MKSRRSVCRTLMFCFCAVLGMFQPDNGWSAPAGAFDDPSRILWTFQAKRALTASPALSPDGLTIYVPSADRTLYAFPTDQFDADPEDPTTTLVKWSELRLVGSTTPWRFPAPVYGSPTVDEDGAIFVSCTDGKIYKITDQGTYGRVERPRFFTRGTVTPAAIGEDGTVYAGSSDNHLYAFFPDGARKWAYASSNDVRVPVITDDEEILVASGGFLRTISADGAQVAEFSPRSRIQSIPALGHDGEIYLGANDNRIYALGTGATTNDVLWRFNAKKNVMSSPAVGADGRVYIAADNLRLYSFTTNGAIYWSRGLRAPIRSALSIGVDGSIYAGADDKRLYAFSPEDGSIIWSIKTKAPVRSSAVLDAFGVVYFTSGKTLYAVESDAIADDSDEAPWPMFRKDARHTARATECRPFLIEEPFLTGDGSESASISNELPASISVVVRAGAPVSYQWRLNGVDIDLEENPTAGNSTLEIAAVSPLDAGEYTVVAFNDCGEVESEIFTLNVDSPPIITSDLTNQLLLVGSTLTLRVEAAGTPPLRYEWSKDGVIQPGFTNATLSITNVSPANSGVYQVIVANQFGSVPSSSATVTVYNVTLALADQPLGAGQRHSLAVLSNNTLWTWGLNNFGQLGDGTSGSSGTNLIFRNRPNLVGTNGTVTTNAVWAAVSGGSRGHDVATNQPGGFSIGLQTNGTLWAWGLNNRGQLGIGSLEAQRVPVQVGTDTNWIQAEAGATHVIALKRDGTLWTWGGNEAGQLGIGSGVSNSLVPVRVGTDSAWVEVRAGGSFSLARRADGTLWAWGTNANGQLGIGNERTQRAPVMVGTNTDWVRISAGVFHSLGLRSDGSLWAWGRNNFGQLGLGTGSANGNEGTGTNAPGQVGAATDWQFIEAGRFHSFGIRTGGALWGWGANHFGQVGDGAVGSPSNTNDANRIAPVPVAPELAWRFVDASAHSLGMTTDGRIWGWGWNNQGQVGDGTGNGTGNNNRSVPVLLTFNADTNVISTNSIPLITEQPVDLSVNEGSNAGIAVTATGQAPLTYQWYFNSNAIPAGVNSSAATATLVITNATSTNAGFYHVIVNNLFGSATSSVATLTVLATNGPPVITQQPPAVQTGSSGGTVTFTVAAAGATPLFYQWYFNSNAIALATNSTATSPTLVLTSTTTTNNGFYHAVITNSLGSATSSVSRLALLPPIFPASDDATESSVALRIKSIQSGANGVTVTVDELPSGVLILEFKEALNEGEWRPLMTNEAGRLEFIDPVPADRARFYRVRME